ncbi:YvrJ family protein [Tindallia californiensis]|uniref:YvrJ family protein n=1 Tax=Tindallia californiensis TaxID=159292 RepID=UPI0038CDC1CB
MSKIEDLFTAAANVGFPMVLSIYLLVRLEGKIENLSDSVHELATTIAQFGRRD